MGKKNKTPKLSKKELRKLAEKAERKAAKKAAAKAERKAQKKADAKRERHVEAQAKTAKVKGADRPTESPTSATGGGDGGEQERHPHLEHLDRVAELQAIANDENAKPKARKRAEAELEALREQGQALIDAKADAEKTAEQIDEEIKARLERKRAERAAKPGSPERTSEMQRKTAEGRAERHGEENALLPGDQGMPYNDLPAVNLPSDEAKAAAAQAEEIALPSETPKRWEDDTNGLGQYKVQRPSDGKIVGYTRVTTYIDALEDKTNLTKWKMRILLEGVAAAEEPDEDGKADPVTGRVRELVHRRDVAIAKARKADRKGKLAPGQLATLVDGAWGDFKKALNVLADELFELGGGREAAMKGTDIHALCDLYDSEGIDAVQDLLDAGEITPADFLDVEAYAGAIKALGLKVVAAEQVIVDDENKVAGRLDRIYLGRLPEIRDPKTGEIIRPADTRARRYIGDLKTGNVEYSPGKIAQQIRKYADGMAYDPETHERTAHGANRTTGILVHIKAGTADPHVHLVDLTLGDKGNKLAAQVRAFRNEGKRAIDFKTDLLQVAAEGSE